MPSRTIAIEQAVLYAIRCWAGASVETLAKVVLEAVPDGWAKVDGCWIEFDELLYDGNKVARHPSKRSQDQMGRT